MNKWQFVLAFSAVHLGASGSKVSVPYGLVSHQSIWLILLLIFILDVIQIPIFFFIYNQAYRIKFIRKLEEKIKRGNEKHQQSRLFVFLKKFGALGVLLLSANPFFGGGIWTSTLLAHLTGMKKVTAYILICLGILINVGIVFWVARGIDIGFDKFF